jgi:hypothetical protein
LGGGDQGLLLFQSNDVWSLRDPVDSSAPIASNIVLTPARGPPPVL